MRRLIFALFALAAVYALPSTASAASAMEGGNGGPAAAIAGAIVGGAVGYYIAPSAVATAVGAVVGGMVGHWWYRKMHEQDIAELKPKGKSSFEGPRPALQLISLADSAHPALRTGEAAAIGN